jgi:hypothetical protein
MRPQPIAENQSSPVVKTCHMSSSLKYDKLSYFIKAINSLISDVKR